ncbi:TonB-dependent receptor domain-containing protein [Pendulispora albinea]|uniref:TonB-dependent receptor n=1 Tax=Pendulispora albinea TaxID=2741071 RepID=A0ABZ2M6I2_9BACT
MRVVGDPVRAPVPPKDPGVAGSVIPRERLVGPGLEAQDVLRTQPGVAVIESGGYGAPATAAIRGATAAATPVYLGGVRLNDDVAGTADLSMVPLWLIDRVEIYRGNAPIEADRLAPGGAIFFEPRRPSKTMGGAGYYGGSWGASKGWAYQGVRAGAVRALVGVSADHATNRYPFLDDHGTLLASPRPPTWEHRQNADQTTYEGWGLARIDLGRGASIDILANGITREQGVPKLGVQQSVEARGRSERALGSIAVRLPIGTGERYVLDARTSVLVGATSYDDPRGELVLGGNELSIVGRRIEQSLGATLDLGDRLTLRPTVNLAHEAIRREPNDIPVARAHREYARLAVSAEERLLPWLTLRALASGECHRTGAKEGTTCDVLEPAGRVGFQLGQGRVRVLGNVGRYARVPTLGEVYGVSNVVHGNPDLSPETGYTVDAGVRLQTKRGAFFEGAFLDAFVFAHWSSGLIAYRRAGQGYVVPYNVGSARVAGAELLGGVAFTKILRAEVATTLLEPRDTTDGRTTVNDVLPFRSRLIAVPRLRADWKRGSRSGVSALGGELRAVYQSSRYADPAGLGVIDEQTSFDLEGYVSWFDGLLTARGRVADLGDARRTDIIGYPLPGRSVYFGLEATW